MSPSVGRDSHGRIAITAGSSLSPEKARWLRDRIDEELALLDGGKVAVETPATEECDADRHPKDGMGAPEYDIDSESDTAEECPRTGKTDGLGALSDVGPRTAERLRERGIETVADVRETPKEDLLAIEGIGGMIAGRMLDEAENAAGDEDGETDEDRADETGEDEPVLDHERVATAMDQIGIEESVSTGDFVRAVDVHNKTFQVASQLSIPRADVADLIQRLDLEDALESTDGVAEKRFGSNESERGETT